MPDTSWNTVVACSHSFPPSDLVWAAPDIPNLEGEWCKVNSREWRRTDVWGNVWGRADDTSMGEIIEGALDDLGDVESIRLPDFSFVLLPEASRLPRSWGAGPPAGATGSSR